MMHLSNRLCATYSLALAFGLGLAACGDDDGGSTTPTASAANTTKTQTDAGDEPATSVAATAHSSAATPTTSPSNVDVPEEDSSTPAPDPTDDLPVDTAPEPTDEPDPSTEVPAKDAGPDGSDEFVDPFPPDAEAPAPECIPSGEPLDMSTCDMHFSAEPCQDATGPGAYDLCGFFQGTHTPELFSAALDCYLDQDLDQCAADAKSKFQACMEAQVPTACVTPVAACDTLATDCTEVTAAQCNAIMSSLTPSYAGVVATAAPNGPDCLAMAGSGVGCGAVFEACVYSGLYD